MIARPHVGIAGHAMLHFWACDSVSGRGMPYSFSIESTAAAVCGRDVAEQHVLLRASAARPP